MTPTDLARTKALRLTDAEARAAAEFAAARLGAVMAQRDGVVSRAELTAAGLNRSDIDRLLRRKSLRQVHRRVYVDHTGPLTQDQRVWAAVLAVEPAVVCGPTLISPNPKAKVVHVAVDAARTVDAPGVRSPSVRTRLRRRAVMTAAIVWPEAHLVRVRPHDGSGWISP